MRRILALESHALALKETFPSDEQRTEAHHVLTTLQLLEIAVRGTPSADVVRSVEELLDGAAERMARVGGAL